ncbi:MAG: DNA-binding response regulator [Geobacteraceae bacterium]|nr:MAG: DNA-binding response regulator [Geobacteraceae bacterium]
MEKLRVLIVDDHPIIRGGLLLFMKNYPDIEIVGTASDGMEGLAKLRRLHPDCMIVDLAMPKLGGVEAIQLYLKEKPDLGIVVYTGKSDDVSVYDALQAGARAYVLKGSTVSFLVRALREVHRGGYLLSAELNTSIIKLFLGRKNRKSDEFSQYNTLSDREKQVFSLLAKGKSPKEIGEILFISIKTVSKHQTAIKEKLKVRNTAEMAIYAIRIGLAATSDV